MNWREDIAERFEMPGEALGTTKVTMSGKSRVLIESHKGIVSYGNERVELECEHMNIRVLGTELNLAAMDKGAVLIRGRITAVELD